jgi:hypothetical protein
MIPAPSTSRPAADWEKLRNFGTLMIGARSPSRRPVDFMTATFARPSRPDHHVIAWRGGRRNDDSEHRRAPDTGPRSVADGAVAGGMTATSGNGTAEPV